MSVVLFYLVVICIGIILLSRIKYSSFIENQKKEEIQKKRKRRKSIIEKRKWKRKTKITRCDDGDNMVGEKETSPNKIMTGGLLPQPVDNNFMNESGNQIINDKKDEKEGEISNLIESPDISKESNDEINILPNVPNIENDVNGDLENNEVEIGEYIEENKLIKRNNVDQIKDIALSSEKNDPNTIKERGIGSSVDENSIKLRKIEDLIMENKVVDIELIERKSTPTVLQHRGNWKDSLAKRILKKKIESDPESKEIYEKYLLLKSEKYFQENNKINYEKKPVNEVLKESTKEIEGKKIESNSNPKEKCLNEQETKNNEINETNEISTLKRKGFWKDSIAKRILRKKIEIDPESKEIYEKLFYEKLKVNGKTKELSEDLFDLNNSTKVEGKKKGKSVWKDSLAKRLFRKKIETDPEARELHRKYFKEKNRREKEKISFSSTDVSDDVQLNSKKEKDVYPAKMIKKIGFWKDSLAKKILRKKVESDPEAKEIYKKYMDGKKLKTNSIKEKKGIWRELSDEKEKIKKENEAKNEHILSNKSMKSSFGKYKLPPLVLKKRIIGFDSSLHKF